MKSDQILETVRETEESRVRLKIFSLSSYMGEAVEELILEGRERVWGRMVEQAVGCTNLGFKGNIWAETCEMNTSYMCHPCRAISRNSLDSDHFPVLQNQNEMGTNTSELSWAFLVSFFSKFPLRGLYMVLSYWVKKGAKT